VHEATAIRYASDLAQPGMDLVAGEWVVEALNQARDRRVVLGAWAVAIDRLAGVMDDTKNAVMGKFTQRILRAPDIAEDPLDDLARIPLKAGILVKEQDKLQFEG
jgi:hypothetical protein